MTTEDKKAKHDYSMHQDKLLWSRATLLVAIQGATLSGMYAVRDDRPVFAWLAGLGIVLTILVVLTMQRDILMGNKAFAESGVPETKLAGHRLLKGRYFAFAASGLLIASDAALFLYVWLK
jgi:hypothetical protein